MTHLMDKLEHSILTPYAGSVTPFSKENASF